MFSIRNLKRLPVVLVAGALVIGGTAQAQTPKAKAEAAKTKYQPAKVAPEPPAPVEDLVSHEDEGHPHHVALFGGMVFGSGHSAPAFGLEYEYRLPQLPNWGIGPTLEFAMTKPTEVLFVITPIWHFWQGAKLVFGPGVAVSAGHLAVLLRAGAGYDFHLGPITLGPVAFVDLAGGHLAEVVGLTVGMGF